MLAWATISLSLGCSKSQNQVRLTSVWKDLASPPVALLVTLSLLVTAGASVSSCSPGERDASSPPPQAAADDAVSADTPNILISRQLLDVEGLEVGDTLTLSAAQTGESSRTFRVVGSYEPVPDPMRITSRRLEARLHLPDFLELTSDPSDPLSAESVTGINVALMDPADAPSFARDLSAKVPGLIVQPTAQLSDRAEVFAVLEQFHLAVALVTMVGSTAFLLALMFMFAEERREAVGILRLIGVSKHRILLQVMVEGLLIALIGALFGILLAAALQDAFNLFFQWHYDTALVFVRITPFVALRCLTIAVPFGVLASVVASRALLRKHVLALVRR